NYHFGDVKRKLKIIHVRESERCARARRSRALGDPKFMIQEHRGTGIRSRLNSIRLNPVEQRSRPPGLVQDRGEEVPAGQGPSTVPPTTRHHFEKPVERSGNLDRRWEGQHRSAVWLPSVARARPADISQRQCRENASGPAVPPRPAWAG